MNKFTEGPWIHSKDDEHYHSVAAGCGYHVNSDDDGFEIAGCISKANAMLIAAAPDLLEALILLDEAFCSDDYGTAGGRLAGRKALIAARAAIAKARGEA